MEKGIYSVILGCPKWEGLGQNMDWRPKDLKISVVDKQVVSEWSSFCNVWNALSLRLDSLISLFSTCHTLQSSRCTGFGWFQFSLTTHKSDTSNEGASDVYWEEEEWAARKGLKWVVTTYRIHEISPSPAWHPWPRQDLIPFAQPFLNIA